MILTNASGKDARERALNLLRDAVAKSKRQSVPFVKDFVRSASVTPPLARMIRGGHGGEVRLKLYLTITMMATDSPHVIRTRPTPRRWAEVLAVTGASPARRVLDGLWWLDKHRFIDLVPQSGSGPQITLLDPTGDDGPYSRPRGRSTPYITLPVGLWEHGWILELSAKELALMMVVLDIQHGKDAARYVTGRERLAYGLSPDTWTKARKSLEDRGLLKVTRVPQGGDFDYRRMRNIYRVNKERLSEPVT